MTNERGEVAWFRRVCRMIAVFPLLLGGAMALTGVAGFQVLFGVEVGVAMRIFFATMVLGHASLALRRTEHRI